MNRVVKVRPLESIRGIAALIVVNWHFVELFARGALVGQSNQETGGQFPAVLSSCVGTPARLLIDGEFAVRMFFVLSGFVLSLGYTRRRDGLLLRSASVRRLPRLAVPALCSIVLSYAFVATGLAAPERLAIHSDWLDTSRALADTHSSRSPVPALQEAATVFFLGTREPSYNRALWTMRIELNGSLLVFAILALFGTARYRLGAYVVCALVLSYVGQAFYTDFIVGLVLCEVWAPHADRLIAPTRTGALASAGILVAGLLLASVPAECLLQLPFGVRLATAKSTIAAAAVIAGTLASPGISRLLSLPVLVWLGRISFSVYLLHLPVMLSMGVMTFLAAIECGTTYPAALGISFAATLVTLIPLSYVFTRTIDDGAVQVARWCDHRLNQVAHEA